MLSTGKIRVNSHWIQVAGDVNEAMQSSKAFIRGKKKMKGRVYQVGRLQFAQGNEGLNFHVKYIVEATSFQSRDTTT